MPIATRAGALYAIFVFAFGFVLGTPRVLILQPLIGEMAATVVEIPIILAFCWWICGWLTRRMNVAPALAARLVMGLAALSLLLAAEAAVSMLAFGRTLAAHWSSYRTPAAQIGLAAQLVFALIPAIQGQRCGAPTKVNASDDRRGGNLPPSYP